MKVKQRSVCQTCRDRKLGCDGKQPECSQCLLTGRTCDGYQSDWTFVSHGASQNTVTSTLKQHTNQAIKTVHGSSKKISYRKSQRVEPEFTRCSPSLSSFRPHGRPLTSDIAKFAKHGYLPEILSTLGHHRHEEPQICGAWVEVLPMLPCLAHDASVLSKATRALAILIGSQRKNISLKCDVESPQSYHDAIHTLRGQIAAKGLSFELMPAIMCLALVELMLPSSVLALKVHLQAIGTLFQSYGPEALQSDIAHKLFLGFRPFIIAEAVRDRKPTFLATKTWMEVPFLVTAPSSTQELFSWAATIPCILRQIDMLPERPSFTNVFGLRELIDSLFEVLNHLSAWENSTGFETTHTPVSIHNLKPGSINISHISSNPLNFPNISVANGLTHGWAFRIICLLELQNLLLRYQSIPEIRDQQAVELNYNDIRAEADHLALLICSSLRYLLQDQMKLFGPVSTLFPTQVAYAWFKRDETRDQRGLSFIKGVVTELVQKGIQSAPLLIFGEDLY